MCSWACLRHQLGGCCKSTMAILILYLRHDAISQLAEMARLGLTALHVLHVTDLSFLSSMMLNQVCLPDLLEQGVTQAAWQGCIPPLHISVSIAWFGLGFRVTFKVWHCHSNGRDGCT